MQTSSSLSLSLLMLAATTAVYIILVGAGIWYT